MSPIVARAQIDAATSRRATADACLALEILESMLPVCEVLDGIEGGAWFEDAIDDQVAKVRTLN